MLKACCFLIPVSSSRSIELGCTRVSPVAILAAQKSFISKEGESYDEGKQLVGVEVGVLEDGNLIRFNRPSAGAAPGSGQPLGSIQG